MVIENFKSPLKDSELEINKLDSNKKGDYIKDLIENSVTSIKENFHPKTMMDNDEILLYFDGYYHQFGDKYIRTICDKIFGKYYNSSIWKSILDKIKASTTTERKTFTEPNNKINLKNGVLDINTLILEPHNPKYNFLYKIDINYNINAKCLEIEKFLMEAVCNNNNDFLCLQEYIGYTLYPEYKYDKFLVVHGEGGHNRKSKTFSLITKLLGGNDNVSSSSLQSLGRDKFECSMLYGKKANICSDITSEKISLTGEIKRLLGSDPITAQRKHERQFQFINKAKLMFSCNMLPMIDDNTSAWWNKILLLSFEGDFSTDTPNIMDKITTKEELEGFLIFAIEGLKRLLKNEKFTYDHEMTKERWDDYLNLSKENDLSDFKDKTFILEVDQNNYISRDDLYELYIKNENGNAIMSLTKFTQHMKKFPFVDLVKRGSSGKQIKVFTNIKRINIK